MSISKINSTLRVVLKIGGCTREDSAVGFNITLINFIAGEIHQAQYSHAYQNPQLAVVVGGRVDGSQLAKTGISRQTADEIGIISTIESAKLLYNSLSKLVGNKEDQGVRLMSELGMKKFAEEYNPEKAKHHLKKNRIVILAGGTGSSRASTDSAAVQKALELDACAVLKGTGVDGIMDQDPKTNKDAKMISGLTYEEFLKMKCPLLDPSAIVAASRENLPIRIFNILKHRNLLSILKDGKNVGSLVSS